MFLFKSKYFEKVGWLDSSFHAIKKHARGFQGVLHSWLHTETD